MTYMINLHDHKRRGAGRNPTRRRFICFELAFHGRPVFALRLTQRTQATVITKDFHGRAAYHARIPSPALNTDGSHAGIKHDQRS